MWQLIGSYLFVLSTLSSQKFLVIEARPESLVSKLDHYQQQQQGIGTSLTKFPERLLADVDYFDKLDVDSQLNNKRFVELQIKCLVYEGPCDTFGRKAKALLPSVILDNCRLCTNTHKNKLSRIMVHFQQNYPGAWRDALVKYGGAPRFITAGHVAPQATFFGGHTQNKRPQSDQDDQYAYYQTPYLNPVLPTPLSMEDLRLVSSATLVMPALYFSPSSAPEPIPAVESPSPIMEPTLSPFGVELTSSAQPPSTPVVESTIDLKPTTLEPHMRVLTTE